LEKKTALPRASFLRPLRVRKEHETNAMRRFQMATSVRKTHEKPHTQRPRGAQTRPESASRQRHKDGEIRDSEGVKGRTAAEALSAPNRFATQST